MYPADISPAGFRKERLEFGNKLIDLFICDPSSPAWHLILNNTIMLISSNFLLSQYGKEKEGKTINKDRWLFFFLFFKRGWKEEESVRWGWFRVKFPFNIYNKRRYYGGYTCYPHSGLCVYVGPILLSKPMGKWRHTVPTPTCPFSPLLN